MKQLAFGILLMSLFAACSNDLERKIEGKWQLKEVIEGDKVTVVDTVYYNFQNTLFMYQIANGAPNTNAISYGYKTEQNDGEDLLLELEDANFIKERTDWTELKTLFTVEDVSHSKLILKSNGKIYQFDKF
jgi:hypothetical protein